MTISLRSVVLPLGMVVVVAAFLALSATGSTEDGYVMAGVVPQGGPATVLAAGDIANCNSDGDEAVASVMDTQEGTVLPLGDIAYPDGAFEDFSDCYEPGWGRHKARTFPVPGNHEYRTSDALPYFAYFGANSGEPGNGYYSYDLGAWHLIALNSNCDSIGGCDAGSPQYEWLGEDLAANSIDCTLAYWHHPMLTIGPHENDEAGMIDIWQALYDAGTDVVLTAHEHAYQRYAPLNRNADGVDHANGMRTFVVGTGGSNLTDANPGRAATSPGLEWWGDVKGDGDGRGADFGVIKLLLAENAYEWEFLPVAGGTFTDVGQGDCHGAPGPTPAPAPTLPPGAFRWADADCDGALTARDSQAIMRLVLSQAALSQDEPCFSVGSVVIVSDVGSRLWGDADCDGAITTRDNQSVLRSVLQQALLSQTEPCPDIGVIVDISA